MITAYNSLSTRIGSHENAWLRRFSKLTCTGTLFLIFVGGMVKSTDSGLAVPDWPLSYGMLFPPMVGGVFYEHGHRMVAALVGFLILIQAIWIARTEKRTWVKILGWAALIMVIGQGLLGGLTVKLLLPDAISIAHGLIAQTFFLLTIWIAYSMSQERRRREDDVIAFPSSLIKVVVLCVFMFYVQLFLGALMRHTESGLAIYDFPKAAGYWFPPFNETMLYKINDWRFENNLNRVTLEQVSFHFIHRIGAILVSLTVLALNMISFRSVKKNKAMTNTILILDALVIMQIFLGALTIWYLKAPVVTSLHVVTGAACLGLTFLLLLRVAPLSWNNFVNHLVYR